MAQHDNAIRGALFVHSFLLWRLFLGAETSNSRINFILFSETISFYYGVIARSASKKKRCTACVGFNEFLLDCKMYKDAVYHHSARFEELELSAATGCDLCRYFRSVLIIHAPSYTALTESTVPVKLGMSLFGIPNEPPLSLRIEVICDGIVATNIYAGTTDETSTELHQLPMPEAHKPVRRLRHVLDIIQELRIAAQWLQDCRNSHPQCASDLNFNLPARLLDVGDPEQRPALFATKDAGEVCQDPGTALEYCALSYCWGPDSGHGQTIGLTRTKLSRYTKGIAWDSLPKTIQDAIIITRSFGVRYLWVDALCIIQPHGGDNADWYAESSRMCDIYRNAVCTISAQGASNANSGCFIERHWKRYPIERCKLRRMRTPTGVLWPFILPHVVPGEPSIDLAPLNCRAWTLQERYLSSRVLYWTGDAIFWECGMCRRSHPPQLQSGPSGSDDKRWTNDKIPYEGLLSHHRLQDAGDCTGGLWMLIVIDFSSRRTRVLTDRLVALSGVARTFQRDLRDDYLAGLWRKALPLDLLWYYTGDDLNVDPSTPLDVYVAPSWSWLSRPRSVTFVLHSLYVLSQVHVNHGLTQVQLCSEDPYGAVSGGQLCIKGPLLHVSLGEPIRDSERAQNVHLLSPPCRLGGGTSLIFDDPPDSTAQRFLCLLVAWTINMRYYGLILKQDPGSSSAYRRIGLIQMKLDSATDKERPGDIDSYIEREDEIIVV